MTYSGTRNPNWKGGIKEQTCNYCKEKFVPNNPYSKRKFCSHKCSINNSIGRKINLHPNTLKAIEIKKINGLNNPNKKCSCGNKKEIQAKTCYNCFKLKIKPKPINCLFCSNQFIKSGNYQKFCNKKCFVLYRKEHNKGSNNPNWKGGIKSENLRLRNSDEYKFWRKFVFERDNFICQDCGQKGGNLHAHHIKSFSKHKDLRFELSNGKTLCASCHSKYHPNMNHLTVSKDIPLL